MIGVQCGSCCCPAKVNVTVKGCAGNISGATVDVYNSGMVLIGTCTTSSSGNCVVNLGSYTGAITVTVTLPSGAVQSQSATVPTGVQCPNVNLTFTFVDKICVTVSGCDGPISGVPVTLSGGATASGTTNSSGQYCYYPTSNVASAVTASVTWKGRTQTATSSGLLACFFTFSYITRLCFCISCSCVGGCGSTAVSMSITVNGNAAGSGNTDRNEYICFNPLTYGAIPGDTLGYTISATGYQTLTGTLTLPQLFSSIGSCACGACQGPCTSDAYHNPCPNPPAIDCCHGTQCSLTSFTLSPDSSHCCPCNYQACAGTLTSNSSTLNDGFGNITGTLAFTLNGVCFWRGCAMRTSAHGITATSDCLGSRCTSCLVPVFFTWSGCQFTASVCNCCDLPRVDVPCPGSGCAGTQQCTCSGCGPTLCSSVASGALTSASCEPIDASGSVCGMTAPGQCNILSYIYGDCINVTVTA